MALTEDVHAPLRTFMTYEPGVLVRALQRWTGVDRPEDQFLVHVHEEEITVRRDQIDRYTL